MGSAIADELGIPAAKKSGSKTAIFTFVEVVSNLILVVLEFSVSWLRRTSA
jgi:hypothetical protein